jgi:hypothetical protein
MGRTQPRCHCRRQPEALGLFYRCVVTRVGMPQNADTWIAVEYALQPCLGLLPTVGDDGDAGADAMTAQTMDRDEVRSGGGIQQSIKDEADPAAALCCRDISGCVPIAELGHAVAKRLMGRGRPRRSRKVPGP